MLKAREAGVLKVEAKPERADKRSPKGAACAPATPALHRDYLPYLGDFAADEGLYGVGEI